MLAGGLETRAVVLWNPSQMVGAASADAAGASQVASLAKHTGAVRRRPRIRAPASPGAAAALRAGRSLPGCAARRLQLWDSAGGAGGTAARRGGRLWRPARGPRATCTEPARWGWWGCTQSGAASGVRAPRRAPPGGPAGGAGRLRVRPRAAARAQVRGLEFNSLSPNLLASGGADGELCIWDVAVPSAPSLYPGLKARPARCPDALARRCSAQALPIVPAMEWPCECSRRQALALPH